MLATPSAQTFAEMEGFFQQLGAPIFHEVSPLASPETLQLLTERGYRAIEFTNVLFQPLQQAGLRDEHQPNTQLQVRRAAAGEALLWSQTSARGWSTEGPELESFMLNFGFIVAHAEGMQSFLVEDAGQPIASGGLYVQGTVALLAGASTVPEGRGRGAQRALLAARLHWAARHGCTMAMMCAQPGSQSQRNAQRAGFQVAYTRLKWQLPELAAEG
jgi:GNAT superfamily N-acetyltransferase